MKRIADLVPGDELAQDILAGTQVLLRRGTVLAEAQIERLQRMNLDLVKVVEAADDRVVFAPQPRAATTATTPVQLPSFASLSTDATPSWISDSQFSKPVPCQPHTPAEKVFRERKSVLREQAGLKPLLDPAKDEELTRRLEATFIQSAVQRKVFLDRLEALAQDLTMAIDVTGEYLDFNSLQNYLPFDDITKHGQHLIASCMQTAKMYRLLVLELPEEQYQSQLKAHLAMSSIFTLLPSHFYTHSMTSQGEQPALQQAVTRYTDWLADQQYVAPEVLHAAEQRLLCQHHPDPAQSVDCSGLPAEAQRLALAGFYCERLYSLPNRPRLAAHDAAQLVVQQAERLFASREVNLFLQRIGYFPLGSLVELSDGSQALVVRQNRNALLKPVVQLITSDGELDGEHNLMQTRDLYIRRQVLEY